MKPENVTARYAPRNEPFFTRSGWIALTAFAFIALILLPSLYAFVPDGNPLHVSAYTVTLVGKIMCYAIVAMAMKSFRGCSEIGTNS